MDTKEKIPQLNQWTIAIIWMVLLLITTYIFNGVLSDINNPNKELTISINGNGEREVVLERNKYGHYVATGKINGHEIEFLLDTGATLVAIPEHIAEKLQLEKGISFQSETANGLSQSYTTNLATVALGDIVMTNVKGSISSGMKFDEVLLGMSFLKHLRMTQQGKTLIIGLPEN